MPGRSFRSAPAQKTGPAPRTKTTFTLISAATVMAARRSSSHIVPFSALRASGRSSVIVATPASAEYLRVEYSAIRSARLQAGGTNQLHQPVVVLAHEGGELLGREQPHFGALRIEQALLHCRIAHHLAHRRVHRIDDCARRAGGRGDAV